MQRRTRIVLVAVIALVVAACGGGGPVTEGPVEAGDGPSPTSAKAETSPAATQTPTDDRPTAFDGPSLWVAANEGYTLLRYTPDLDLVDRADEYVGDLDLSTTRSFHPMGGLVWFVTYDPDPRLVGIDPDGYGMVREVNLAGDPFTVSAGADRLWVSYYDQNVLTEVAGDGSAETFEVAGLPGLVLDEGDTGWLFDYNQNRLYRFGSDPSQAEVGISEMSTADARAAVDLGDSIWMTLEDPSDILLRLRPDDGAVDRIWCDDTSGDCEVYPDDFLSTYDLEGGATFGEDMVEIDGRLYVVGSAFIVFDSVPLYVIDPASLKIVARTDTEPVEAMAKVGDELVLLVSGEFGPESCGRLYRVDPGTLEVKDQVDLPGGLCPDGMAVG